MGASSSQPEDYTKKESVAERLDYIATYYILTSDFISLKNLYKKEYCDDLVILTSDIIEKNLTYQEVSFLQRRIINGEPVNQMTEEPMIWFSNSGIKKEIGKSITNEKNKSRMCIGIAKFYIKIAHVFAAIITSINPMYSYTENGEEKQLGNDRNNIPPDVDLKFKLGGLCESRIEALSDGYDYINVKNQEIDIGVNLCDSKSKMLIEEPGIPELEKLYYDEYDYKEGRFYGMTDKSKKLYEEDVKAFYETIMDTDIVPESIKKFSDIKLRDFANSQECQNSDSIFKRKFKDSTKNALFLDYINNIQKMIGNSKEFQDKLLILINRLFVYTLDTSGDKLVRVDPLLTMTTLEEIIIDARKILIKMYLTCEDNFNDGVKIFRSIAATMTVYRLRSEIQELERVDNIQEYLNGRYKSENVPEPVRVPEPKFEIPVEPTMEAPVEPKVETTMEAPQPTTRVPVEPSVEHTMGAQDESKVEPDFEIPDDISGFDFDIPDDILEPTMEAPVEPKVEPVTEALQPTMEAPQPTTEAPIQPTMEAPQPTTEAPQPTMEAPQPTTEAPIQPTMEAPIQPTTEAPIQPTIEAPQPTTEAPQPTTEAPIQPTMEAPQPTTEAPQPTTEAPQPTIEAPQPTMEAQVEPIVEPNISNEMNEINEEIKLAEKDIKLAELSDNSINKTAQTDLNNANIELTDSSNEFKLDPIENLTKPNNPQPINLNEMIRKYL